MSDGCYIGVAIMGALIIYVYYSVFEYMPVQEIIRKRLNYFRNCYQADSREVNLDAVGLLTSSKAPELVHFLDGEEFLARGTLPSAPLPPEIGQIIDRNAFLYARELQLLYGVFFVSGVLPSVEVSSVADELEQDEDMADADEGRKRSFKKVDLRICAPVLYYEAAHVVDERDQSCLLSIDVEQPLLNRRLLRRILRGDDSSVLDTAPLPPQFINDVYLADLLKWLEVHCFVDSALLAAQYPHLQSDVKEVQKPTRARKRSQPAALTVFPSAAVMMVQRGSSSRGITYELQKLTQEGRFSGAMQQLLGQVEQPLSIYVDGHLSTRVLYEKLKFFQKTDPESAEVYALAECIAKRIFEDPAVNGSVQLAPLISFVLFGSRAPQLEISAALQKVILKRIDSDEAPASLSAVQADMASSPSKPYVLPAVLSRPQTQALFNAATQPLSLVSGPPGTGKSYTLAAMALDRFVHNESVLIVTRTQQAASVIANKLRDDMGITQGILDIGDSKSLFMALKKQLTQILNGQLRIQKQGSMTSVDARTCLLSLMERVEEEHKLRQKFEDKCLFALKTSKQLVRHERRELPWWQRIFRTPITRHAVKKHVRHWKLQEQLGVCQSEREQLSADYLNAHRYSSIQDLLKKNRETFVNYRHALMRQDSATQSQYFERIDFALLLKALPIWVVTLDVLHRVLPFGCELFDLLIVDEATQCDVPSVLPAIHRCKRAVVTGDAQQLRHISFLARQQEVRLYEQAGLQMQVYEQWSYRSNSLLDLTAMQIRDQQAITFLDEHFRSRPELIRFSNEQFYNNRIKVMKERPELDEEHSKRPQAIILERLEGERSDKKDNRAEVLRVIEIVQAHVKQYESVLKKPSIGILSPFRAQVDALRTEVAFRFTRSEIAAFNMLVATPYGFQGEERDLMILSFALDSNSRQASVYLNRSDMFNVAITRAREQQYVLFSGDVKALPTNNLLRFYLQDIEKKRIANLENDSPVSGFHQQVIEALRPYGVRVWTHYPVAGQLIDLICCHNGKMLAIDLIGFPGLGEEFNALDRYQILARAGLEMIPVSYGVWTVDREATIQAILGRLNIEVNVH